MRIVVAAGSYKGTMKSIHATETIARALQLILPTASVTKLIMADGGEGTLEMFVCQFGATLETCSVRNAAGDEVPAAIGLLANDVVVIESAQAVGLSLLRPNELNPFRASSYGVGQLIRGAVARGAKRILVTMGDSATMDMGIGMMDALGVKFYGRSGPIASPQLSDLDSIVDFDDTLLSEFADVTFVGLVDTDDYLCGEMGQVQLYGRQKGLADKDVPRVEQSFQHFSEVISRKRSVNVMTVARATGSGGTAAALHAFLGAELVNTLEFLSAQTSWDAALRTADITLTGEGCLDNQTRLGKVPYYVASRSRSLCAAIVGSYTAAGLADLRDACPQSLAVCLNPHSASTDPHAALHEATSALGVLLQRAP